MQRLISRRSVAENRARKCDIHVISSKNLLIDDIPNGAYGNSLAYYYDATCGQEERPQTIGNALSVPKKDNLHSQVARLYACVQVQ